MAECCHSCCGLCRDNPQSNPLHASWVYLGGGNDQFHLNGTVTPLSLALAVQHFFINDFGGQAFSTACSWTGIVNVPNSLAMSLQLSPGNPQGGGCNLAGLLGGSFNSNFGRPLTRNVSPLLFPVPNYAPLSPDAGCSCSPFRLQFSNVVWVGTGLLSGPYNLIITP